MPKIVIKGTSIDLPSSGSSPSWSPAIIEAFELIADAVNTTAGTFDIAPQTKNIDLYPATPSIEIDNLSFPPSDVRAVTVFYTVFRKTTTDPILGDEVEVTETGTLECVYNESRVGGKRWEVGRIGEGDAFIDFSMTDPGQILFSTSSITGDNHTGIIAYRAISILNLTA